MRQASKGTGVNCPRESRRRPATASASSGNHSGAGAGARGAIGFTVLGGMLAAPPLGLLVIPALYAIVQRLAEGTAARFGGKA